MWDQIRLFLGKNGDNFFVENIQDGINLKYHWSLHINSEKAKNHNNYKQLLFLKKQKLYDYKILPKIPRTVKYNHFSKKKL